MRTINVDKRGVLWGDNRDHSTVFCGVRGIFVRDTNFFRTGVSSSPSFIARGLVATDFP